jgi:hypothetical protein
MWKKERVEDDIETEDVKLKDKWNGTKVYNDDDCS